MEPFIKADIFFFVTTVAIIFLTLLISIALIYAISFARNVYRLSKSIKTEADSVVGLIRKIREMIEEKGMNVMGVAIKVFQMINQVKEEKPKRRRTKKDN